MLRTDGPEMPGSEKVAQGRWRTALASTEGKVLVTGLLLAMLYLAVIGLTLRWSAGSFHRLLAMTGTHLVLGRAAGLTAGYATDLPTWVVIGANIAIETIVVLIFYPVFVFSTRKLFVIPVLSKAMVRAQRAAEAHQAGIRKYGIPMLFLFVWFPLYMTGPLVGVIIGYLIGLRPLVNLPVVLGGTYVAILCWGLLLQRVDAALEALGPYPSLIFVALVLLVALALLIRHGLEVRKGAADEPPTSQDEAATPPS